LIVVYDWLRRPFAEFFRIEASGGILLILATLAALIWANSSAGDTYQEFWHTYVTIGAEGFKLKLTLAHWINDGLMAIFFFLVGLEIKRELLAGELASPRRAALPMMAALGGMVVPALLYTMVNRGGPGAPGWGIPMATDIAFALGILLLLGKRVPLGLKVFLTALAIVDDLGAVLVIALFYTSELSLGYLGIGIGLVGFLFLLNRSRVRVMPLYIGVGIVVWLMFLKSGVHATIAGVLVATTIPDRVIYDRDKFLRRVREIADYVEREASGTAQEDAHERELAMQALTRAGERWSSPLQRMEHALAPFVAYVIMPVFALANAGVRIDFGTFFATLGEAVPLGIILGLVVGKQVGVFLFSWIAVKTGLAQLPQGVGWRKIYGAAALAGIGFTMSLFIANLAFTDAHILDTSKVGILSASFIAAILGTVMLVVGKPVAASGEK
jgi:NhaA family Na+:H+ antiporter